MRLFGQAENVHLRIIGDIRVIKLALLAPNRLGCLHTARHILNASESGYASNFYLKCSRIIVPAEIYEKCKLTSSG